MADVEERKRALEEKRRKLEELRKRNAEKKDEAKKEVVKKEAPAPSAKKDPPKKDDSEVDSLVASLISKPVAQPEQTTPKSPEKPKATQKARKANLVAVTSFAEFNVVAKPVESYSKEVQTMEIEVTKEEEEDQTNAAPVVHSSLEVETMKRDHQDAKNENENEPPPTSDFTPQQKKEVMESDNFQHFFSKASLLVERALGQTGGYDFMVDYSADTQDEEEKKKLTESLWSKHKFFDERWTKYRSVTDIAWSPQFSELLLASYNSRDGEQLRLDQTVGDPDGVVLVWNLNLSDRTEFRFHCQSAVMTAQFSKFSPNIIIGGTYSGQIVLWDTRAKSAPVQRTPQSNQGHTHPVYSMAVVGTENAHNLATVSTDGRLCVWSLGMLTQPQETIPLKQLRQNKDVPVTALAFPSEEVNTFFVGSEEGVIYQGNRHGSKEGIHSQFDGHYGPIMALDFFSAGGAADYNDLFLSCGTDWTVKLWSHRTNKCLYSFEEADDYIYDVRWSPVHPAVFACCDGSGHIEVWNLNEDTEVPIVRHNVGMHALNKLRWSRDGKSISVGDSAGNLYVFNVSQEIHTPKPDDLKKFDQRVNEMRQT